MGPVVLPFLQSPHRRLYVEAFCRYSFMMSKCVDTLDSHLDTKTNAWTYSHKIMSRIIIFGAVVTRFELAMVNI